MQVTTDARVWLDATVRRIRSRKQAATMDSRPRSSNIRNLVKVALPLLFLDTLVMLTAFGDDKQRGSDKIAETVVVRA